MLKLLHYNLVFNDVILCFSHGIYCDTMTLLNEATMFIETEIQSVTVPDIILYEIAEHDKKLLDGNK